MRNNAPWRDGLVDEALRRQPSEGPVLGTRSYMGEETVYVPVWVVGMDEPRGRERKPQVIYRWPADTAVERRMSAGSFKWCVERIER